MPNVILEPARDEYSFEVHMDEAYQIDTIVYGNGAMFYYTFDSLYNRSSNYKNPAAPKAELLVLYDSIPDTLGIGVDETFSCMWRNSGVGEAGNFRMQAFFSLDSIWDSTDMFGGYTYYTDSFLTQHQEFVATHIKVPTSGLLPNTLYWLFLFIDDNNRIVEYCDSNNIYGKQVYIQPCATAPLVDTFITHQACGLPNGRISLQLPDGYFARWYNDSRDTFQQSLIAGVYHYDIINESNYCTYADSARIMAYPILHSTVATQASYCGLLNGVAMALPLSGTAPYTYSWSNGATTPSISGLAPGSYYVLISDSFRCNNSVNFVVSATPLPSINFTSVSPRCGLHNGLINATVHGGIAPYTYTWSTGENTTSIDSLQPFVIYSLTITDSVGCSATQSVQLLNSSILQIRAEQSGSSIQCNVLTGTLPYNYLWNTGAVSSIISVGAAGMYWVQVTDGNACVAYDTVYISSIGIVSTNSSSILMVVYPNPNRGDILMVACDAPQIDRLIIYNETGSKILEEKIEGESPFAIYPEGKLAAGNYVIHAVDEQSILISKAQFVIK